MDFAEQVDSMPCKTIDWNTVSEKYSVSKDNKHWKYSAVRCWLSIWKILWKSNGSAKLLCHLFWKVSLGMWQGDAINPKKILWLKTQPQNCSGAAWLQRKFDLRHNFWPLGCTSSPQIWNKNFVYHEVGHFSNVIINFRTVFQSQNRNLEFFLQLAECYQTPLVCGTGKRHGWQDKATGKISIWNPSQTDWKLKIPC